MHTIGDVTNRDLVFRNARIKAFPHVTTDRTVKFADTVGGARGFKREDGHAERLRQILDVYAAQTKELIRGELELLLHLHERVAHQVRSETVVSCFDRGV